MNKTSQETQLDFASQVGNGLKNQLDTWLRLYDWRSVPVSEMLATLMAAIVLFNVQVLVQIFNMPGAEFTQEERQGFIDLMARRVELSVEGWLAEEKKL